MAAAILLTAVCALAGLTTAVGAASREARRISTATLLAGQKMEQLRGLRWTWDSAGLPASDLSTSLDPGSEASDGQGLSNGGRLDADTAGYVDYLDAVGLPLAASDRAAAAFVRRWRIDPLESDPADTLILQVRVVRRAVDAGASAGRSEDVLLATLRTRMVR